MSDRSPARDKGSIDASLYLAWSHRAKQIVLAVCCFALPILFVPFVSRESGTELWVRAGLSKSIVRKLLIPEGAAGLQYALVEDRGIYRSSDNGISWSAINDGLPKDRWGIIRVHALAVDGTNPLVVFAGQRGVERGDSAFSTGLYWTNDGGNTWMVSGKDMAGKVVQAIAVTTPLVLPRRQPEQFALSGSDQNATSVVCVATVGEIYGSTDGGRSWSRFDWRGVETKILSLAFRPGDSNVIYVGTKGAGLYSTENGGVSWIAMNQGLDALDIHDIAISVSEPRLMYLATNGGIYKAIDGGSTWTRLAGPTSGRTVNTIALHPQDGNFLCVGLQHGGVYCSADGGKQWKSLKKGVGNLSVMSLVVHPGNRSILWAGTADGVWRCVLGAPISLPATATPIASATPSPVVPTHTATPYLTATRTEAPPLSASASPTVSPTATAMPTVSLTASPTATYTPEPLPTHTSTLTPTFTATAVPPTPVSTETLIPR